MRFDVSKPDENRYDPQGDAIRKAVSEVRRGCAQSAPGQHIVAMVTARFVSFGALGDREPSQIELCIETETVPELEECGTSPALFARTTEPQETAELARIKEALVNASWITRTLGAETADHNADGTEKRYDPPPQPWSRSGP
jgi:hypothetical protein